MNGVKERALVALDRRRLLSGSYLAGEDKLGEEWYYDSIELVRNFVAHSRKVWKWFIDRFGWADVTENMLKDEQEEFLGKSL